MLRKNSYCFAPIVNVYVLTVQWLRVLEVQFCNTDRPQFYDLKWQVVEHVG